MTPDEMRARLIDCLKSPNPDVAAVKERWDGVSHTVRVNGKWRLEGFVTFLIRSHELLRCVNPSLHPLPPSHLFEPEVIAWMFGIPPNELGCRKLAGKIGTPGRPATTRDLAEFAFDRRPRVRWKDIFVEWKRLHPQDVRGITEEKMKEAFRRAYRRKDQPMRT